MTRQVLELAERSRNVERPTSRTRSWVSNFAAVFPLAVLANSSTIKGVLGSGLVGVDITLLAASATLLSCVFLYRASSGTARGIVLFGFLWVLFLGGVDLPLSGVYETSKVSSLFSVTLLCALGGLVLLGTPDRRNLFVGLVALWGVALSVVGLVAPNTAFMSETRRVALDVDAIMAGRGIAAAGVVFLAWGLRNSRWRWMIVVSVLLAGMVLASGSRGPVIALFVAMIVVGVRGLTAAAKAWMLVAGAVTVYLIQQPLISLVREGGFLPSRVADSDLWSAELRQGLMGHAFQTSLENPLGVGWAQWGDLLPARLALHSDRQYPHNLFLEVGAEAGIIAAIFLAFVSLVAIRGMASHDRSTGDYALLGLLTLVFLSAMVSDDVNDGRLLWVLLGLGVALWRPNPQSHVNGRGYPRVRAGYRSGATPVGSLESLRSARGPREGDPASSAHRRRHSGTHVAWRRALVQTPASQSQRLGDDSEDPPGRSRSAGFLDGGTIERETPR